MDGEDVVACGAKLVARLATPALSVAVPKVVAPSDQLNNQRTITQNDVRRGE